MKLPTSLLLSLLLLIQCEAEDQSAPADLQFQVSVKEDGSGEAAVTATAKHVSYYDIFFGEFSPEAPVRTTNGNATYLYSESGTYQVTVRAHATPSSFITKTQEVTVVVSGNKKVTIPATGYETPLSYDGMALVWQDEFSGAELNPEFWTFEMGTGSNGWGNNELQYYRQENTAIQDGHLIITAKRQTYQGNKYTSSRIITKDKKVFQYGRVDIRATLPKGQGIWPALWMLGSSISTVGWPKCGEIDIMEMIGGSGREKTIHGTVHWDHNGQYASYGKDYTLNTGSFQDEFHVFSIVWNESTITWYVDDVQFNVIDITPDGLSEFRSNFFFIFNVAVGGNWPGSPDGTTVFPQHLIVDYIRMFQSQ